MRMNETDKILYSDDKLWPQIKESLKIIFSYALLFIIWQITLSFQSGLYTLVYCCSFAMIISAVFTAVKCPEERAAVIKGFKLSFTLYSVIIFVYDFVLEVAVMKHINSVATPDATLITAGSLMTNLSLILKISGAVAYITWCVKTMGVFRTGISRAMKKEQLRDIRVNSVPRAGDRMDYNDRF